MTTKTRILLNGSTYHIFNRGVEKREIFSSEKDYARFFATLLYYQQQKISSRFSYTDFKIAEKSLEQKFKIIAYCLMPNHFHLMLEQICDHGIEKGISDLQNSYTKYFNKKLDRVGPLFQGRFQSIPVLDDEQYIHLARYIIINPYVSFLTDDLIKYLWGSYREYFIEDKFNVCEKDNLLHYFAGNPELLKKFITNYQEFARTKEIHSKLFFD